MKHMVVCLAPVAQYIGEVNAQWISIKYVSCLTARGRPVAMERPVCTDCWHVCPSVSGQQLPFPQEQLGWRDCNIHHGDNAKDLYRSMFVLHACIIYLNIEYSTWIRIKKGDSLAITIQISDFHHFTQKADDLRIRMIFIVITLG